MDGLLAQISFFTKFYSNIYIADFFDVLIIATLIYFVIFLFKQTRSLYTALGFGIIISLYPIAQAFGLFLTSIAFQAFWGVFFIALVVIFQEELRKFFEQLAIWSTRRVKRGDKKITQPHVVAEILNAVTTMSQKRIGALIVMQGKDSLKKFISGGKILDGVISEELLLSLFDPSSIGHDGALVVSGNRISLFGGHLPLSHDFGQLGKRGTRHSAGLGLAELTDAFVIAVSEERGDVSYMYRGKLKSFKNPKDINIPLTNFINGIYPKQTYSISENLIKRNSIEKIISLAIAVVLWFFFSFQAATTQRDFEVPITFENIGDNFFIESTKPDMATITLEARGTNVFNLLDPKTLSIVIDASKFNVGAQRIALAEDQISRPLNFSVINVKPQEILVTTKSVKTINMRVVPKITNRLSSDYLINSVSVSPDRVEILVPESYSGPDTISTEPVIISEPQSGTLSAKLVIPQSAHLKKSIDSTVNINIDIRER